jgi:glutamyl-tRNA reductase
MLARGDSPELVLEQLAHGLTQKYLHGPMAALNRSESGDERRQLLNLLPRLLPRVERHR